MNDEVAEHLATGLNALVMGLAAYYSKERVADLLDEVRRKVVEQGAPPTDAQLREIMAGIKARSEEIQGS